MKVILFDQDVGEFESLILRDFQRLVSTIHLCQCRPRSCQDGIKSSLCKAQDEGGKEMVFVVACLFLLITFEDRRHDEAEAEAEEPQTEANHDFEKGSPPLPL